ncbi:phosphatidylglycerol lysyltransferase [Sphingobium sp. B2D3A]|uniref:bifunctional lysylphosphatidylglycerol flippase/synthetase MprF n=1 Tax=unclassified Sphingobium TaxID=2611147 RepID=UPI002224DEDE|nr:MULTISPECIES: bifunctional lysylphosphatidylglycerol flippase/synthetase MprF [unclassified Sphingobium]MCW2338123.1 phosphatidylglycerol lysyltransferase [Sphingobium sp. B2D3A]MCW2384582.1 phosphatidylglycerol lysyltransferase [Sphingobium sp. B2D3D]
MKTMTQRHRTILTIGVALLLAVLGFVALSHLLREVHLRDVRAAFHALPPLAFLAAALLTACSYAALTLYDVMALRTIGRPLPYRTAAIASFTSYTLSHNLGLSLLTGGSARYRVYSAAGLGAGDIARVILIASLTFWSGVFVLSGAMLAWRPEALAFDGMVIPPGVLRAIGFALLLATAAGLLWSGGRGRTLHVGRWSVPLPPAKQIIALIGISALDLAAASAALFVLIPGIEISAWPAFFIGYTLAIVAVLVTHVPGGIGVFEAIMLIALPNVDRPELVAALLAYRLIYYIAPLIVAAVLIVVQEGARWHKPIGRTLRGAQVVASGMAPLMISALVFFGGTVLLISGSLPTIPWRANTVSDIVPLPFVELSHMAGSLIGAALLVLSAGLYRRLDGAFWLTRLLLLAGAVFSIVKGLDYEEAGVMLLIAAALQWSKPAFYRRTRLLAEAFSPGWLATIAVVVGLSIWIGLFAYRHVDYQNDLWWRFAERADAARFLRASLAVAVLLVGVGLARLFEPARAERAVEAGGDEPSPAALALADRTDANLAFTGDKRFLHSQSGRAFLMYQIKGASWIVMGDPVGAEDEWSDLLWDLREKADAAQGRLLLYQISPVALPMAIELGLRITKYGEEAHVDLATFSLDGPSAKSLRHAERRATREGATFEFIPATDVPAHMGELERVSDFWLKAKGQREKGFSVGRFDPAYLARFDCAVVRSQGQIVAFANIWPTQTRSELSIDLMRHDDAAPYGAMDFLFIRLMQWGQQQGYRWFNIGMAPLSGLEARRLAPLWSKLGAFLYQHGNAFYGFEGLRAYKEKFSPEWEPRYIAGPQGISLARALIDLQSLIGGSPQT